MIDRLVALAALIAGCAHEPRTEPSPPVGSGSPAAPAARTDDPRSPGSASAVGEIVLQDDRGLLPNLRLDTVQVASGLDLTAVVDRLRAELPNLRRCFSSHVTPRPRPALTISLSLRIDGSSQVVDANVRGADVPALRQCIAATLVGTTGFPPPPGGGSVVVEASLVVTPVR